MGAAINALVRVQSRFLSPKSAAKACRRAFWSARRRSKAAGPLFATRPVLRPPSERIGAKKSSMAFRATRWRPCTKRRPVGRSDGAPAPSAARPGDALAPPHQASPIRAMRWRPCTRRRPVGRSDGARAPGVARSGAGRAPPPRASPGPATLGLARGDQREGGPAPLASFWPRGARFACQVFFFGEGQT